LFCDDGIKRMKVLAISNFYPPHYVGGYELGCYDVLGGLKARGHQIRVLTSTYGVGHPQSDGEVYRWLRLLPLLEQRRPAVLAKTVLKELEQRRLMTGLLRKWQPDLLYVWNLAGLSLSLPPLAQSLGVPVCYFISDHWLLDWDAARWHDFWSARSSPLLEPLLRLLVFPVGRRLGFIPARPLDLRHVQFASSFLKRSAAAAGKPVLDAEVIHWGIRLDDFPFREVRRLPSRLLFVGQMAPHKGVRTAIEATELLVHKHGCGSVRLTIVGGNNGQAQYVEEMKRLVDSFALWEHVEFTSLLPRRDLSGVYRNHDIFIFPSVWEEPFSIAVLEAMASGLAVVGTHTGGSPEVMNDEVNSLVFPKGDAQSCATRVLRLLGDANLCESLRRAGRRTVEEKFPLGRAIDRIEEALLAAQSAVKQSSE
jgi:glycogen synthase